MSKEKFDRSKPHVNIGDIKTVDHGTATTEYAIKYVQEGYKKYTQMILQDLINKYGEEEGKRYFEILKQNAKDIDNAIQNIDFVPEEREEGINISKGR